MQKTLAVVKLEVSKEIFGIDTKFLISTIALASFLAMSAEREFLERGIV